MKLILLVLFFGLSIISCGPVEKAPAVYTMDDLDSSSGPRLALPDMEVIRMSSIEDSTLQSGFVNVRVVIQTDGTLTDIVVHQGLGRREDSAAVERVKRLPDFIPGKVNGKAVKVMHFIPILIKGYAADTSSTR